MPKASVFGLKAPKRKIERRTFTDPDHEDEPVSFCFGSRNFLTASKAMTMQTALWEKWGPRGGNGNGEQPVLPIEYDADDTVVYADEAMCQTAAVLWSLQGGEESEQYTEDELLVMQVVRPRVFEQAILFVGELNGEGTDPGNASRGVTAPS